MLYAIAVPQANKRALAQAQRVRPCAACPGADARLNKSASRRLVGGGDEQRDYAGEFARKRHLNAPC